jgi:ligand-binding sensor domain-containing protein/signal transduction histidine kinase/DNA-binding response OmpR family regulator
MILKRNILYLILISIIYFLIPFPSSAQENRIVFSHLDVNDGLSGNWIKCIIKDRNGFIWFGTNSGLNRYDGYEFEISLKKSDDSASVYDNDINAIAEDNEGNLWIGTRNGVNVLDINTYKYRRITLVPKIPNNCQSFNYITTIASDSEGNILIGTQSGLFHYNQDTKSTDHILFDEQSCSSPFNNITAIAPDNTGSVWVGTSNGYIYKYSLHSNAIEKLESLKPVSSAGNSIRELFVDNDGTLWVADRYGLYLFNIKEREWESSIQKKIDSFFSGGLITGIDQNIDGQIWITTDGKGLYIIDKKDFRINNLMNLPYVEGGISSNGLLSLYCDPSGITWIGTAKKGVDFYKKNARKFQLIRNYPTEINSLSNNDVNGIAEDVKGNLWIGTNGGGLNYLNRKTNKITRYTANPDVPNSLSSKLIVTVFEDSEQNIWVGTFLGGLNRFDPETGKFTVYRYSDTDSTSISDNSVWGICEDSRHNIWIATLTNGLNMFDRKTGKFRRYVSQNSSLCFNYLNSVTADKYDNLWICSSNGLIYFNPGQNISICYTYNPNSNTSVSDNHISSVFEDSRGLFWVCTSNGLDLMDRKSNTFRAFYESDGLPSNSVLRILEDKDSNLWISTKNGISKLIISKSSKTDSLEFSFKNYRMSDGLQGKEFNETAAVSTRDGSFYFGGPDGLNTFNPLDIWEDTTASKLAFTNLRVFNNIIRPGEEFNSRILLGKPIFNSDEITLRHDENSFTIDFAALNYFFPEKSRYAFKLEGFNDSWVTTEGKKNFANYSNLNHGSYTFRLKGTNSDGIWNKDEISLKIKILPPLWKTWYANILYVIIVFAFLVFMRFYLLNRERLKTRINQERIESQHTHEIDTLKIKFFTSISHEFRTPLTLILSPVEQLMLKWKDKPEEKQLSMIRQNARRLLLMVNQLLDFRKMEVQGFRYSPSYGDIVNFLRDVVNSFNDLSEQKHIRLSFNSEIDRLDTYFDKDKIEKTVFNLLSNAFRFVHENGKVSVKLSLDTGNRNNSPETGKSNNHLIIEVEDDGIGIPPNKQTNLFTRFYQVETPDLAEQGNGIGLSLVNEFVKLHGGDIVVKSDIGKGSTFIITIPVRDTLNLPEDAKHHLIEKSSIENNVPNVKQSGTSEDSEEITALSDFDVEMRLIPKNDGEDNKDSIPALGKPIILIAEDNDDLRFYLKENLQSKYHICEAANGETALKKILKIVPDLIITDIMMPVMDGVELCKRVKNDKNVSHIPLILLTAKYSEQQQLEGIEAGADDYITKPFNFQILVSKIDNFVKIRKNIRSLLKSKLNIEPNEIEITSLDEQFLQKAIAIVEKNMSVADFTVEELSRDMGMSRSLLYKKILTLTGKPPLEFIRYLRLKRAALLLQKSQLNVSEITFRVGFKDPKYFRKHFLKEFGILPSRYSEQSKI